MGSFDGDDSMATRGFDRAPPIVTASPGFSSEPLAASLECVRPDAALDGVNRQSALIRRNAIDHASDN
jgi:hypothetical protein